MSAPRPAASLPRSILAVGVEPELRPSLPSLARGRVLVIRAHRSRSCCAWIGDLTVDWRAEAPAKDVVQLESIDGVRVYAGRDVVGLLRAAGASIRRGGLPFRRGLSVELERPEMWIDYLERPSTFATSVD